MLRSTIALIRALAGMFPQLADKSVDRETMVREWAIGLANMRPDEIERGLAACRMRKFAPSLGEFAQLCRPALDPEMAFYEAERGLAARAQGQAGVWSHPAIWRAATQLSSLVREGNYAACRRRWEFTLGAELERGWLEDVTEPQRQLEAAPLKIIKPPPHARAALARFKRQFSGETK